MSATNSKVSVAQNECFGCPKGSFGLPKCYFGSPTKFPVYNLKPEILGVVSLSRPKGSLWGAEEKLRLTKGVLRGTEEKLKLTDQRQPIF